jgi:ubiquinone/menaquinone biosynthesis C-methylase UbiE
MHNKVKTHGVGSRIAGKGVFPYQAAFTLLIPLRNIFISPRRLVRRLALEPGMQVLELGPGPGYFSIRVTKALAGGCLVLADIQPEMLAYARRRLEKRKIVNVEYYLCDGKNFDLPDSRFDRIFMVTVLGEVENREEYMEEFRRLLKPGGILSVSEQAGDPDKMSVEELQELAGRHGFSFDRFFGSKRNFTINFRK